MPSITGPITGLINEIRDSVTNLIDDLTGAESDPNVPAHPLSKDIEAVLSKIDQKNWMKLSFPYTFSVVDVEGNSNNPFTDFPLPLSPSALAQNEPPAVSIKSVQGGTSVNHGGMKYKTLNIEGTTGMAPFRGTGGVARKTGEAIFAPDELKYRSGYEVFLRLRNWFRAYYEYKKNNGKSARGLRMTFKNYKDGEFLIVELLNFDMDRQAARSLLYDYKMEFKVLAHLNFIELSNNTTDFERALEDASNFMQQARGVLTRSQGILRQIESTYNSVILEPLRQTTLALNALQALGATAGDVGSRIISNTVGAAEALAIAAGIKAKQDQAKKIRTTPTITGGGSSLSGAAIRGNAAARGSAPAGGVRSDDLIDPRIANAELPADLEAAVNNQGGAFLNTLNEALFTVDASELPAAAQQQLAIEQANAAKLPRSFFEDAITEINRVRSNAEDFFNLGDSTYDSLFDRTATLSADFTKVITDEELEVLFALNNAVTAIRLLLSTEDLFRSNFDERVADIVDRFDNEIELFGAAAVRKIVINNEDTLERIAQRELGDSTRWGEIVEVNNLKPPYFTTDLTDTRSNIVKPGDEILIPAPLINGFSQVPQAKEIKTTVGLTELEKSLGTDFKLTKDNDLALSASGDLELVSGTDNMAQAILLKLSYEPREVIRYPLLGAGIRPGRKFPQLEDIRDGLVNTLLQDNRIQTVNGLAIRRESSALFLTFNVILKQVDIPIPIKIKI